MSTLLQIKLNNQSRATNEKKQETRHKAALLLTLQYLISHGYIESARHLEMELGPLSQKLACADNMDLDRILVEYEEYYKMKFGKSPVFLRKNGGGAVLTTSDLPTGTGGMKRVESNTDVPATSGTAATTKQPSHRMKKIMMQMETRGKKKDAVPVTSGKKEDTSSTTTGARSTSTDGMRSTSSASTTQPSHAPPELRSAALDLIGKRMNSLAVTQPSKKKRSSEDASLTDQSSNDANTDDDSVDEYFENRLLKPLPPDLMFGEYRDLAETIRRDIIVDNPSVFWDDIAGLEEAKQLVTEAVIMPIKFPQFFKGLLQPWRGILLYGPPGTGKTMLAKAVATECKTTFFNISASSIVSKWRGESEKLVRVLFELARHYAPSTIFLDELDSIMSQRQGNSEHEGSRRMKTEILIQMDGLAKTNERVFVLAASNLPWDLDQAILRRLEKRIYVGLPEEKARKAIFESLLPEERADRLDYDFLAQRTEHYSGADITLVCKEAAMRPIRRVMKQLESVLRSSQSDHDLLAQKKPPQPEKVKMRDLGLALKVTKPSGNMFSERYEKWQAAFGSTIHLDDEDDSGEFEA